jgi:FkbM family methyltransferase
MADLDTFVPKVAEGSARTSQSPSHVDPSHGGAGAAIRRSIQRAAERAGYRITQLRAGQDAAHDIKSHLAHVARPVILDVGANVGQSVALFRDLLPDSQIHCFEPGPSAYEALERNTVGVTDLRLNQVAVGATPGTQRFFENEQSVMSSFLTNGAQGMGAITHEIEIPVITLDAYCSMMRIEQVDLLKNDTQGYELEVLKGAERLLREGRVRVIHTEIIFTDLYENAPAFDELYRFLTDRGIRLVALYNYAMENGVAAWCDALFAAIPASRRQTHVPATETGGIPRQARRVRT